MHNYKELTLWKKSRELVKEVYALTESFPNQETYGLTSQIRRSVISIPSNIAEGAGRNSQREFAHFLSISQGSCYELETQLILAQDISLISEQKLDDLLTLISEIQRMNRALQKNYRKSIKY